MHFTPSVISRSEKPACCLLRYGLEILPRGGHGRGRGPVVKDHVGPQLDGRLHEDSQTQDLVRCLSLSCAGSCRIGMEKREKLGGNMRPGLAMVEIDNMRLVCLIPACSFLECKKLALTPRVTGLC